MEDRHIIVLRCEDVPLRGLLADNVYQDLVGITDPEERKRRIIAAAQCQSQAVPPRPRPFIGVPPRIAGFTGRGDELDRLDAILMQDKPAAVTQSASRVAVQGMGGVGKTSLAVEYAHRYRNLYAGACWCPAETRASLLTSLAELAATLGAASFQETDVEKVAIAALRHLSEQRATWLLVYDNVTAPDEIGDLLPSAGTRVLITSRFSDWGGWAEEVAVDVLSLEESVLLLQRRAGRNEADGAQKLAEALGRLPLALDHAAAYCKRTQMLFADYATKVSSLIATAPRGVGYPRSVAATFDLAISQAVAQCPSAEPMMAFLAQCAPERIPMTLVEGAIDEEGERLRAIAALAEMSLVRHDAFEDGKPALTVHRLVRAVARARSHANGAAQDALARVRTRLAALYSSDPHRGAIRSRAAERLLPHILTHSRSLWPRAAEPQAAHALPRSWVQMALSKVSRVRNWRRSTCAAERQLTVMFCDLVNTTAASERLTPTELVDFISSFQSTCAQTIANLAALSQGCSAIAFWLISAMGTPRKMMQCDRFLRGWR